MNVLIAGLGNVGKHYFNLLKKMKIVNQVFIMDNDKKLKKNKNYQIINKIDLDNKKIQIDYAIICTPSGSHYDFAEYFLKKKIPTLIEKPFVISLNHAKKLI